MKNASKQRLLSLDTLRGFDMFWIIGGGLLFQTLAKHTDWAWADSFAIQMHHVKWEGFRAYDLIFPLFMFIAGVAIPYALFSKLEKGVPKVNLYKKVGKRAIILVLLGLVYNSVLDFEFETLRTASVLAQIGLAYLLASIIAINFRSFKSISIWILAILTIYAILQLFVPVPGHGAGTLSPQGCINAYIDRLFLPGRLHGKVFDPEGIMCIVSASAITLMGALAGLILRSNTYVPYKKIGIISALGVISIIAALILQNWYPIIKAAWTSTFNLLTGGISFLLLALFYLVIDVWKIQKWTFFFRVIGLNSITIYLAVRIVNFRDTSDFLLTGIASIFGSFEQVVLIVGLIALEWLLLYFLYKKNIFLKV